MADTKSVNPVTVKRSVTDRYECGTAEAEALQTVSLSELRNKCLTENISCRELASLINSMVKRAMTRQQGQADA